MRRWNSSRALAVAAAIVVCTLAVRAVAEDATSGGADSLLSGDGLLESFSLSADRGPVKIEASTLEFEYRTGELTYQGGVKVSQGDISLSSDELRLKLNVEDMGRPQQIVAQGHVRIVSGERIATGGRAVFNQGDQTITLSEDAVLRDGPNEVSGEKIIVFLDEERSVVEGGTNRVRAVLFPSGESEESDSTTLSRASDDGR